MIYYEEWLLPVSSFVRYFEDSTLLGGQKASLRWRWWFSWKTVLLWWCLKFPELKLATGQPPRPPVSLNDRNVFAKDSINFLLAQNCPSYPDIGGLEVSGWWWWFYCSVLIHWLNYTIIRPIVELLQKKIKWKWLSKNSAAHNGVSLQQSGCW